MPGVHSGSASLDDCGWIFPDKFCVRSFLDRFPHLYLDSSIVSQLWLCWVKGVCVFRCKLPPALLAEWPGPFTCHCGNMRVELTPNKSQHKKCTLEKKILLSLLPGFKLTTFWSQVQRSYQQTIPASKDRLVTWYLMPSQPQRSYQGRTKFFKSRVKVWFSICDTSDFMFEKNRQEMKFRRTEDVQCVLCAGV